MSQTHANKKTLENFHACPVCLGIPLKKLRFQRRDGVLLILDYCQRCQGMWFDYREVNLLREMPPQLLKDKATFKNEVFMAPCHQCHQLVSRDAKTCLHCKQANLLDCPICQKAMKQKNYGGLKLDVCKHCRGVWWDSHELAQLWDLHQKALPGAAMGASPSFSSPLDDVLDMWIALEVLDAAPEIVMGMGHLAGGLVDVSSGFISELPEVLASAPELLGSAAELSTSAVEGAAELSGSIFEVIADILSGIFG